MLTADNNAVHGYVMASSVKEHKSDLHETVDSSQCVCLCLTIMIR